MTSDEKKELDRDERRANGFDKIGVRYVYEHPGTQYWWNVEINYNSFIQVLCLSQDQNKLPVI